MHFWERYNKHAHLWLGDVEIWASKDPEEEQGDE
jgi:hypothetical protein